MNYPTCRLEGFLHKLLGMFAAQVAVAGLGQLEALRLMD